MYVTPNDMTTYWNWISGHDLALILDCQGRLWQFRRADGCSRRVARLGGFRRAHHHDGAP